MKKILYIVSTLSPTGPINQLFNIIKNLDRSRFEPHLLALSPEGNDSRWGDYHALGVKIYGFDTSRISSFFLGRIKLEAILNYLKPDLIHSQGFRADLIASSLKIRIPRVCTVRNFPQEDYPMSFGSIKGNLMVKMHIKAFMRLTCCVAVSKAVEKNLNNNFNVYNTKNISNGVDTSIFFPVSSSDKESLRTRLSLPKHSIIWISSGHLTYLKDPVFLLKRWTEIHKQDEKNVLLLIGGGPLFDVCKDIAKDAGNILIRGSVDNVSQYLQASDYFLSASRAEGLPNSVLEALACNLPVLLSNIDAHAEIHSMNQSVGDVYSINDPSSFLYAMQGLTERSYGLMSSAAMELINSSFSASKMSYAYGCLYSSLLNETN